MEEQVINKRSELWSLSLKDLFYKYVRFLPLFLLSVAVALLIAFAYLRYTTKVYSSTGTMLIKDQKSAPSSDKFESIISGNRSQNNLQSEIEVLKSRPLMERVVNKLGLQVSYTAKGKIKGLNVYKQAPFLLHIYELKNPSSAFSIQVKFSDKNRFKVNSESADFTFNQIFKNNAGVFALIKNGDTDAETGMEYTVDWRPARNVAAGLVGSIKVQPKTPGTSIVSINFQATNPQMAADIVNGLMVQYDSMTVEQNNYSSDQIIGFIDSRLHILTNELDTLQIVYNKFRRDNNLISVDKQVEGYLTKVTESDIEKEKIKFNRGQINEIERYLIDKQYQYHVTPTALTVEDVTLNALVEAYNKSQLERQQLINSNVPPSNPAVKTVEGQIEKLRLSLLENIKNLRESYVTAFTTISQRATVEESRLQTLPYKLRDLVEMERQINTKQALYTLLEGKKEEAAISRASTISNSRIIDMASVSNTPVKPNKKAIQILAILVGIGLPALVIFMGEVLNDKISTRFDIESITNAPIMGEIGHSYSEKVLIANKTSRSMVAEQFRIIRSNLQYVLNKTEKPVILVTSSFSGEGKSFVSTNIGAVIALASKKTIILEFDIRKPKVLSGLGMSKRAGISNFLVGKAELKDVIVPVAEHENLYVLPCGPIPPNPSELLLDAKVEEMFNWLRQNFDAIIVDTAPVGMVGDAMTLGKFADCTLYLVRQGHTFKKQVVLIDELYRTMKLPKVSIVINDVKVKPGYGYYGYGRYGYGYGYGQKGFDNYYTEEEPPSNAIERFLKKLDLKKMFRRKE